MDVSMLARHAGRTLVGALVCAALGLAACGGEPRPSILLITLDTTRADALSCLGGRSGETPELDALAARSTLFTQARSETNVTNPSHVTIMSGLHALDHGVVSQMLKIPKEVTTLPEVLSAAGFATAAFVSSRHVGPDLGWRGFDTMPDLTDQRSAKEVTDLAVDWLGGTRRPFFAWVHYWDPHMRYEPSPEDAARFYHGDPRAGDGPLLTDHDYFDRFPRDGVREWLKGIRDPAWAPAMYAAEVHGTDREVGRLLRAAREAGGGDLIVVAVADHGESLGEHEIFYAHTALYEPQLRIPLIIHVPGAPPHRVDAPVGTVDVAPTLAELAGVELPAQHLAGVSLVPLVRGGQLPGLADRVMVHENAHNHGVAVRRGRWKLIWGITPDHPLLGRPPQLFDLEKDPGELHNLAEERPEKVAELRALIEPWVALGTVKRGSMPDLDPAALERLRALGYLNE
jgi:arylsulfatase